MAAMNAQFSLVEADDRWLLPLPGCRVDRVCIDFAVVLLLTGGLELRIGGPFLIVNTDGSEKQLVPEGAPDGLAAAVTLARRELDSVEAFKNGNLRVSFVDDTYLKVQFDEFEAWELVGPGGLLLVSMPGGDLAVWRGCDASASTE